MDEVEEMTKQLEILSEALREVATDLLKVAKKANTAYTNYVEYVTTRLEALPDPEEDDDSIEIEPPPMCQECTAVIIPGSTHCDHCGEEI